MSRIVAYAQLRREPRYSMLELLYVKPGHRHKRLGSCLMQRVVQELPKPLFVA
jgi:predicted GNAT family acetyltransferase